MPHYLNQHDVDRLARDYCYHAPRPDQVERYTDLRQRAHALAVAIAGHCPPSRERSAALTKLEEAVMHANAAIARNEAD